MIYLIFILLILLTLIVLLRLVNKLDITTPFFWTCGATIISLMCSIYLAKENSLQISLKTFLFVSLGVTMIFLGMIFGNHILIKRTNFNKNNTDLNIYNLNVKMIAYLSFAVLSSFFVIKDIRSITGLSNILDTSSAFRTLYITTDENLSFYTRIFYRIFRVSIIYVSFLAVKKEFQNKFQYIMYLISLILFIICNLMQGSRSDLIFLAFEMIALWTVSENIKYSKRNFSMKSILGIFLLIALILFIFSFTRAFFGRTNSSGILEYITMYLGGSVFSFDHFLEYGGNTYPSETFLSLYGNIQRYFWGGSVKRLDQYVYINGISFGNTFTSFKRYYADFGVFGIVIFSFLKGFIIELIFRDSVAELSNNRLFMACIYAYLFPSFLLLLYDELFFSTKLCFGLVIDVVGFIILDFIFKRIEVRRNVVKISCT